MSAHLHEEQDGMGVVAIGFLLIYGAVLGLAIRWLAALLLP